MDRSKTFRREILQLNQAVEASTYLGSTSQTVHSNSLPNTASCMNISASIPISNTIRRTNSENQLSQDEAEADYKDFLFYSRVVHGISQKQRHSQNGYLKYENQMCIGRIVQTRHADFQKPADDEWSDQLAELGFVDQYHQDPALPDESSEDVDIFILDL
jgi:hypothetical protein